MVTTGLRPDKNMTKTTMMTMTHAATIPINLFLLLPVFVVFLVFLLILFFLATRTPFGKYV